MEVKGLARIYQFILSNGAKQLHQTEMTCEMMKNVVKTVFNEFEKEVSLEESENAEFSNPTEHLYINELDLNLNISSIEDDEYSENELSDKDYEYDVNEIITNRLERMKF
ncbi:hypothetical protein C1646_763517 [Rhizophagus diaphanus]|nr:hypothetical protein C1646_763517 [Rhizophagus diaphanus] [Rhizophagus sp. MUCL 43196]